MENNRPDYIKIFEDIIIKKCPERRHEFDYYFNKKNLSIIDIVDLNNRIFGLKDKNAINFNQKHKSYDHETIIHILTYQQKEKLNNTQLASYFNLSRNTVTKWRKLYLKY
ncbi:helix-turn-helix domain-containing protein [Chryseobacterium sp. RLHN22]|uniref:helix-turn-helix domain-containing protein n=1 Tax=Chryseobacterium sp. RLHN22 TaxID=3437885 RepID=UPI003D9B7646